MFANVTNFSSGRSLFYLFLLKIKFNPKRCKADRKFSSQVFIETMWGTRVDGTILDTMPAGNPMVFVVDEGVPY